MPTRRTASAMSVTYGRTDAPEPNMPLLLSPTVCLAMQAYVVEGVAMSEKARMKIQPTLLYVWKVLAASLPKRLRHCGCRKCAILRHTRMPLLRGKRPRLTLRFTPARAAGHCCQLLVNAVTRVYATSPRTYAPSGDDIRTLPIRLLSQHGVWRQKWRLKIRPV